MTVGNFLGDCGTTLVLGSNITPGRYRRRTTRSLSFMEFSKSLLDQSKRAKVDKRDTLQDFLRDSLAASYYLKRNIVSSFQLLAPATAEAGVDYDGLCVPRMRLFVAGSFEDTVMAFNTNIVGSHPSLPKPYTGDTRVGQEVKEVKLDMNIILTYRGGAPISGTPVIFCAATAVRLLVVRENANPRALNLMPQNDYPSIDDVLSVGTWPYDASGQSNSIAYGVKAYSKSNRFTFLYDEVHYLRPSISSFDSGTVNANNVVVSDSTKLVSLSFELDRTLQYQQRTSSPTLPLSLYGAQYLNSGGIYLFAIKIRPSAYTSATELGNVYVNACSAFSWIDP